LSPYYAEALNALLWLRLGTKHVKSGLTFGTLRIYQNKSPTSARMPIQNNMPIIFVKNHPT